MTAVSDPAAPAWGTMSPRPVQPPPTPLGTSVRRVAVVLVVVAVLVDLAIRTRAGGLAAMLAVVVLCGGLAVAGRVVRPGGRCTLAVAAALSVFLFLRSSPWLLALDLGVIAVLVASACSAERGARPFEVRPSGMVRRLSATTASVVTALPRAVHALASLVPRHDASNGRRLAQLARGLALALPVVVVVGVFLAWADPVFASMFDLDLDVAPLFGHLALTGVALWVACGYFVQASRPPVSEPAGTVQVGAVEGLVVMGALTALYAVFAWSQLVVARRGAAYVVERTGLTYAEYARSGFFQLLWVAAVTVLVLVSLRAVVRVESRRARQLFALLGVAAAALTLVIVHSALVRLRLYDHVFGLTRLRLYSTAFAWWLAAVFVLVGVAMALSTTRWARRDWLVFAIGCSAIAMVVLLNVVNPDRVIVQHNLERAAHGEEFDTYYARLLSADATPALVDVVDTLDEPARGALVAELCRGAWTDQPTRWNVSSWRAASATEDLCR